jgi:peptidoglycan hydrolase CwlO-like protein
VKRNGPKKILVILLIIGICFPITIHARTSAEIAEDIKKQQEALNSTQNSLDQAKKNLEYINSLANNPQGGVAQLENEIKKIEAEINTNKFELELTKKNK